MIWFVPVCAVLGAALGATAQGHMHGHGHTGIHAGHSRSHADNPAVREFEAAHAIMMRDMEVPFTGDPDADFRTHMIPHHQGAIDMSRVAKRHATDPWTRQAAEAIGISQEREIYEFRAWLARRGAMAPGGTGVDTSAVREYKAAHARMMRGMHMPFTGDADVDFRMHMIPHHQGAIDMARVALRHARDPWTRQNAEAIIIVQQQEIAEFQRWLARRLAMVPPGGHPRHIITANSYPDRTDEPALATQAELVGQTWAPGSGVPRQP